MQRKYTCPVCKTDTLYDFNTSEGVLLDFCDKCQGVWFDRGEVAEYVDLAEDVPDLERALSAATPSHLACPKCKTDMQRFQYTPEAPLIVDRCPNCQGVWLDRGELHALDGIADRLESPKTRIFRALKSLEDRGYKPIAVMRQEAP